MLHTYVAFYSESLPLCLPLPSAITYATKGQAPQIIIFVPGQIILVVKNPTVIPQSGARMTRQRAAGKRGGGESRSEERDTEHVGKREQRDCLAPGASLFTAGTNLNAGLTKLSTDKRAHAQGWGGTVHGRCTEH